MKKIGTSWTLAGAIVAGIAGSICCILPVVSLGLGMGSFTVSAFFAPWRPLFLALTALLLTAAWFFALRRQNAAGETCARRSGRPIFYALSIVTLLAVIAAAFPAVAGIKGMPPNHSPAAAEAKSFTVSIPAMDCEGCARGIEASLRRSPGVLGAHVDYDTKRAEISFDPAKTNRVTLLGRIDETGFAADRTTLK